MRHTCRTDTLGSNRRARRQREGTPGAPHRAGLGRARRSGRGGEGGRTEQAPTREQSPGRVGLQVPGTQPSATPMAAAPMVAGRRLFSNLATVNSADGRVVLRHEPGSVQGAIALVAGTTVGAGILALPAVTHESGVLPSGCVIIGAWAFMCATGLLLAEVHLSTVCELGAGGVSIFTMAERTLGSWGSRVAGAAYLLIHYALLIAYTSRSGEILSTATGVGQLECSALFAISLGVLCFGSGTRQLDAVNSLLLAGVVMSFGALVVTALPQVDASAALSTADWSAVPASLPVICLSFVYHNVVPVISTSLEGDASKIRKSILLGTSIPGAMFLIWNLCILGQSTRGAAIAPDGAYDPLAQLVSSSGGSVGVIVQVFSLFAIASSFVGFVLGLTDFIGDALNYRSGNSKEPVPYLLTVLPPVALAATNPDIFLSALNFAGTYGVMVLFGILPPAMAFVKREARQQVALLVPGGRPVLVSIAGLSLLVILTQIAIDK